MFKRQFKTFIPSALTSVMFNDLRVEKKLKNKLKT